MLCNIENCAKLAYKRGMCNAHYIRWRRHGDPRGGRVAHGELSRFIEEVAIPFTGDECLIWPYGKTPKGYGSLYYLGKQQYAHKVVCEAINGPASIGQEVGHFCGRRDCVNPQHVRWVSPSENQTDRLYHNTDNRGRNNWNTKLTEEKVKEIWRLRDTYSAPTLAERFGISRQEINAIVAKRAWGWLTNTL
jgi:hypothetical protein